MLSWEAGRSMAWTVQDPAAGGVHRIRDSRVLGQHGQLPHRRKDHVAAARAGPTGRV